MVSRFEILFVIFQLQHDFVCFQFYCHRKIYVIDSRNLHTENFPFDIIGNAISIIRDPAKVLQNCIKIQDEIDQTTAVT